MGATLDDRQMLARLVGFDSVSGRPNEPIVSFLCDYLDRDGIAIERVEGPAPDRGNLVATAGVPRADRRGLILSGHLDVVPATEPDWQSDPFTLTERDGHLVGRGSCDMKGFVALAVNRLVAWAAAGVRSPLALVLTCDEELGSLGAQALAAAWTDARPPLPRAAIIGEPTSLQVVRMHKGHLTARVTISGAPAHSGSPHLGRNAIAIAGRVLAALESWRLELAELRAPTSAFFPRVPFPVLNVARIGGGGALNVVPDRCTIELGLRALPGQESAALAAELVTRMQALDEWAHIGVEILNDNPPMLLGEEAGIHRILQEVLGQPESVGVSFASDAGILRRELGVESVLFGPGSIEMAHRANEFVPIAELDRAGEILDTLVRRLCAEEVPA